MTVTLVLPAGHTAMGAPNPGAVRDAAGAWFFGLNTKVSGGSYGFRVYRQLGTGPASECLSVQGLGGQGGILLQGDGTLAACAYAAPGDQQQARAIVVAEFVPMRPGGMVYCNPARGTDAINGQEFHGEKWIDLVALFSLPGPIRAADVRLTVNAAAPDIRARLGGKDDPWQLSPFVQVAHQNGSYNGTVYPADGRNVLMSVIVAGGAPATAQLWLNLLAYAPA